MIIALYWLIKNKVFLGLLYVVLLFNPLMLDVQISQRVYREGALLCFSLLTAFSFIGLYVRRDSGLKSMLRWSALSGVSLALFCITKESYEWLVLFCVGVIVVFLLSLIRKKKIRPLHSCLIAAMPFLIVIFTMNLISFVNYQNYGIYTVCDRTSSNLRLVIEDLNMIEDSNYEDNQKVWVSYEALQLAERVSPTFSTIKDQIDDCYYSEAWLDHRVGLEIEGDIVDWALIGIVANAGLYQNGGAEVENFYGQVHKELTSAFEAGDLSKKQGFIITKFRPPISDPEYSQIVNSSKILLKDCVTYFSKKSSASESTGSSENITLMKYLTGSMFIDNGSHAEYVNKPVAFANRIISLYQRAGIPILFIAVVSFVFFCIVQVKNLIAPGIKNRDKKGMRMTIVLIIVGLSLAMVANVLMTSIFLTYLTDTFCYHYIAASAIFLPIIELLCFFLGFESLRGVIAERRNKPQLARQTKRPSVRHGRTGL